MAYSRRTVTDGETVMNKDLYDNVQDGIDEMKTTDSELRDTTDDGVDGANGFARLRYDNEEDELQHYNETSEEWEPITTKESKARTMTVTFDLTDSNPETWATYNDDAVGMTVGSDEWDEFFGHYPCLLSGGGETALLNRNNFDYDVDNNPVSLTGSQGDAMITFPRRGVRLVKSNSLLTISMTEEDNKPGYQYYAHTYLGSECDKFYLGVYKGVEVNSKMRSIKGSAPTANKTIGAFRTTAQANGSGYEQSGFYQLLFRQCMYMLKYKGKNAQEVIGKGYTLSSHSAAINTGGTEAYGMDSEIIRSTNPTYMTDADHHVKLFGLEDFYGNIWEWIDGLCSDASYNILTNPGNVAFSDSGTGYVSTPSGNSSNDGGYMTEPQGSSVTGFVYKSKGGSETTYFCDYAALYTSCVAHFGGGWYNAGYAGVFLLDVDNAASLASADIAGRLMYLHRRG